MSPMCERRTVVPVRLIASPILARLGSTRSSQNASKMLFLFVRRDLEGVVVVVLVLD